MIICSLGLKRECGINPWVACADLHAYESGDAGIAFSAIRQGLLQGKAIDSAKITPYLDGDIWCNGARIGFMMTNETETGIWYTAVIDLIPLANPSKAGVVWADIK